MRDGELHYKLVKDIRENGSMYIKNRLTVESIKKIDSRIESTYDKEDNMYHVIYKKVMPDVVYKK